LFWSPNAVVIEVRMVEPASVSPSPVDLSVVLPSYRNAELALASSRELAGYLDRTALSWEIVIVDDGGHDFQAQPELWELGRGRARLVRLPCNRGKGAAVRTGMLAATGQCRIFTDVDLPYQMSLFPLAFEYLQHRRFHVVAGDRTLTNSRYDVRVSWARRVGSVIFSRFANHLVTGGFYDTQCGFKGFRADVAQAIFSKSRIDRFAFDVEILYLALKYRLDVKRLPVTLRHNETSSVRIGRDGFRMLVDVLRLKANQLAGHYAIDEMRELLSRELAQDELRLCPDAGARQE
jgi:dolichyl-phosphate beta-glucosyltransferase